MKKKLTIILCVVLAVLVAGGSVTYAFFLPHPLNYDIDSIENIGSSLELVSKTESTATVKLTEDRDIKVLCFTDMHLDGKNKTTNVTLSYFVKNIIAEKPDLVILGGDNVTSALNRKRANQFCEIFEQLGVYWAAVLGNHEGDNGTSISREEMIDIFSSYEHSLVLQGPEDIWGNGNYTVNILKKDGTLNHTFVMMDSGNEISDELKQEYGLDMNEDYDDGVKANQVEWYKEIIAETEEEYGDFNSTVVLHIPIPQMKTEAEKGEFLTGGKLEGVCASDYDTGLFDAIKEMDSTKTVLFGHDHVNDFSLMYEGVLLSYMQSSGYGSYTTASKFGYEEKEWLQGYTVLNIHSDGTYTPEYYRNSVVWAE